MDALTPAQKQRGDSFFGVSHHGGCREGRFQYIWVLSWEPNSQPSCLGVYDPYVQVSEPISFHAFGVQWCTPILYEVIKKF